MTVIKAAYRIAELADIPALNDLVGSAYRGERSKAGWTSEAHLLDGQRIDEIMLADIIADPEQTILVFDDTQTLEGCAALQRHAGYGYIGMVTVRPGAQNTAVGRAILQAAEDFVKQMWLVSRARLTVIAQRTELISWYERRGYQRNGETLPFPYNDPQFGLPKRDDLYFVVLEKNLSK